VGGSVSNLEAANRWSSDEAFDLVSYVTGFPTLIDESEVWSIHLRSPNPDTDPAEDTEASDSSRTIALGE
jgi:hypothetical protein